MTQLQEQLEQDKNDIIQDYNDGITIEQLAKKYHHKFDNIKNFLLANGIILRPYGYQNLIGKEKYGVPPEIEQKIIENYQSGMGLIASGKEFNIGYYKVGTILDKYHIKRRNKHEGIQVRNKAQRKYFCNESYFGTQSSNMAYILGFLAADGSVGKKNNEIKLTLAEKDAELLEKIKKELEYTGNIYHKTTQDGYDIATLQITCEKYKKDLAKYNIVPEKTFSFLIPENLDKRYMIDFIRGYWDGDGTICTAGAKSIRSSLCSARKETLEYIIDFLFEQYNIPKVNILVRNKPGLRPLYYFQYSINATKILYKALYYTDNLLYLQRKYEKFKELCIDNNDSRDSTSVVNG